MTSRPDEIRAAVCRALGCRPDEILSDVRDNRLRQRRVILYRDRLEDAVAEVDALVAREVDRALANAFRGR